MAVKENQIINEAKQLITEWWGEHEWDHFYWLIDKESGWQTTIANRITGAYGLCQSLPREKMSSMGADYLTNPTTQLLWCRNYIKQRYGSPSSAKQFFLANNWF